MPRPGYPYPPLTPDNPAEVAQRLGEQLGRAYDDIVAMEDHIAATVTHWRRDYVLQWLAEYRRAVESYQRQVLALAVDYTQHQLPQIYAQGAALAGLGESFSWTQADIDALSSLASDTYGDFLERSREAGRTADEFARHLRSVSREVVPLVSSGTYTATQTAERLAEQLNATYGIRFVTYRNGAIVDARTYTDMAVRTKSAVAFSTGTLNRAKAAGANWVQVWDGPGCGWTSHNDPDKADGKIVRTDAAALNLIAHPNCTRSFGPRPDVKTRKQARDAEPIMPPEYRDDWDAGAKGEPAPQPPAIERANRRRANKIKLRVRRAELPAR